MLRIDLRTGAATLRVIAPERGLERTSALAARHGSVAAVNGGFFAKDGSADDLLLVDGVVRHPAGSRLGAALVVHQGRVALADTAEIARALTDPPDTNLTGALAAGPWLVRDGKVVCKPDGPRHPRTAVGERDGELVFLTVDGRTPPAFGMTLHELAQTMLALGCRAAFNLDGGGSTTMWVRSQGGVVNCPCDDKVFDPAGERAIGNAILVLGQAIWTLDEDAATLAPADAFAVVRDAACIDGDCAVAEHGGSAVFDLAAAQIARARIEVFTRRGDQLEWSLADREGTLTARATGWCVLDEFALPSDVDHKITLRSERAFMVDAVRAVQLVE